MMLPPIHRELPSPGIDTVLLDNAAAQPRALSDPPVAHTDYDLHRCLPIESLEHYIECRLADERFRVT